jgi:hypothetical protein
MRAVSSHEARLYRSQFWVWSAVGVVGFHLNPKSRYDRKSSIIRTPLGFGFWVLGFGSAAVEML